MPIYYHNFETGKVEVVNTPNWRKRGLFIFFSVIVILLICRVIIF